MKTRKEFFREVHKICNECHPLGIFSSGIISQKVLIAFLKAFIVRALTFS